MFWPKQLVNSRAIYWHWRRGRLAREDQEQSFGDAVFEMLVRYLCDTE